MTNAQRNTPNATRILITAGEPSGDRLGGALMAELHKLHPNLTFIGTGGPEMIAHGLKPLFPMSDLSVMGLIEVLPAIPRVLNRIKQLTDLARTAHPDLVITIDSQDFSTRLAKSLKKMREAHPTSQHPNTPTPHIHYVAPKVWAWRQHRALKLKDTYTHLLTILPFEEAFFNSTLNTPHSTPFATYVGHPATTMLASYLQKSPQYPNIPTSQHPTLALLPGSRSIELKRHWPLFLQTYRALRTLIPTLTATLALPDERALNSCQSLAPWQATDAITPVYSEARFAALALATAALSKSGTNNLELALLNTPAVVTYRMNSLTHLIAQRLIRVPFISLPNLILHYAGHQPVYPEFIQHAATVPALTAALTPLLLNHSAAATQRTQLKALHSLMATPQPPAAQAAQVIAPYLKTSDPLTL